MLKVVGRTVDGKGAVSGVYRFFETYGLPLEAAFQVLQDKDLIPCWVSFHREAVAAGMTHERIISKLDPALVDSYGPEFRDHVLRGLERLYEVHKL